MTDDNNNNNRYGWWGGLACGLVVMLVGVVFLLRNLGIPLPFLGLHNWWALFIVVGAVPLLAQAAERPGFTAADYLRVLRVGRTIADLEGSDAVRAPHIAEAVVVSRLPPPGAAG